MVNRGEDENYEEKPRRSIYAAAKDIFGFNRLEEAFKGKVYKSQLQRVNNEKL